MHKVTVDWVTNNQQTRIAKLQQIFNNGYKTISKINQD
jgi:hypothetical protein